MNKKDKRRNTLGIIGGYGKTGMFAVKEFLETTDSQVVVAGHDHEKVKKISELLGTRVTSRYVDVFKPETLDSICQECGIVINCAGPSTVILDKVANAALRHNSHYIDPGGYDVLYDLLKSKNEEIKKRGLSFLISAGWIPGISGIFPKHVAAVASTLFEVESLEIYYGARDKWSFNAASDMVWALFQDSAGVFKDGKWVKKNIITSSRTVKLPHPVGRQKVFPCFDNQLKSFAREKKYKLLGAYVGEFSLRTSLVVLYIKMFMSKKWGKAARMLMRAIEKDRDRYGTGGMLYIIVKGKQEGREKELTATLFEKENYRLTGIVPAVAAKMIMENRISARGSYYLCEAVDPDYFMKLMAKRGITYSTSQD